MCYKYFLNTDHPHEARTYSLDLAYGLVPYTLGMAIETDMMDNNGDGPEDKEQVVVTYPGQSSFENIGRVQTLVHSMGCQSVTHQQYMGCDLMKCVTKHWLSCQLRLAGQQHCPTCDQLIELSTYHAKHCCLTQCPVPECHTIRQLFKQRQQLRRRRILRERQRETRLAEMMARVYRQPLPAVPFMCLKFNKYLIK